MKTQSYNIFWQRIHKVARDKGFPLRVMFELTYRCNFRCRHCYVPQNYRRYGELKTKEVFSILEQLKVVGCFYLGFTGGEPFVRRDIMDILGYARRCGFEIIIYTNGSLITERIADKLAEIRPNKVDITIPAMSKNAFDRITGVSGYRDKVFQAIEHLKNRGITLGFKTCVLKENQDQIEEIRRFAKSQDALYRLDPVLLPRLDGDSQPYKYRGSLSAFRPFSPLSAKEEFNEKCSLIEATDLRQTRGLPKITNLFKCGVGVSQAAITPLGELKMCVMIDYPKYKITPASRSASHATGYTLKDAWEKLRELVKDIKPDEDYKCQTCELKDFCKWCPAKSWLYNKTFTSCEPESRRWAEIRRTQTIRYERDTVQKI